MVRSKIGRYEIVGELGRGGMAQVYLAHDPLFDRQVALKVIKSLFSDDEQFRTRFRREARTVARLEHQAIVPVYDTGEDNDQLYLVMRYMPGDTLRKRLDQNPVVPLSSAIFILNRLAAALESAHRQGVIHRDIKPANVLLDDEGATFLADFGIAHIDFESEIIRDTGSTVETLHYLGSPYYMAPEQWIKGSELGPYTDVYQLGVMLFEMLTGKRPFPEESLGVLKKHHLQTIPPVVTSLNPALPAICDGVLAKAMAKNPLDRYETAQAMADDLAKALNPERVKNRYALHNELARGRLSIIYLAYDLFEEKDIALKRLKYHLLPSQMMQHRYYNLAQKLGSYQHPAIVPVLDMGEDHRTPYVTMPFINGRTLNAHLRREGYLPAAEVCHIARRLAAVLDDIHAHQLVHGDIHPGKVLLDEVGDCFLTALGLTQVAELTEAVLQDDFISSAAPYMAPEQWRGTGATAQTDIYQFGVMLFELLSGQRPFSGPTQVDYQTQHLQTPPPQITAVQTKFPNQFDTILMKAMAKAPEERYTTAAELAAALSAAHEAHSVTALFAEAQRFYEMRYWAEAIAAFEDVLKIQPNNADAQTFIRRAREHQEKTAVYKRGQRAIAESRWQDAIHYLQQVPDYEDSEALLAAARKQNTLETAYQQGVEAYQNRDWLTARASFYRADQIQPNYKELGTLLPAVEKEIDQVLQQAQTAVAEARWQDARTLLTPLAGDSQADALRQQAERDMKNGRRVAKSSGKLVWVIGAVLIAIILLVIFTLNNDWMRALLVAEPTATPTATRLATAQAEQCLREMEVVVTNSQNNTFFTGEEIFALHNEPTILTAITEFEPECETIADQVCFTWEAAAGDVAPTSCTNEITYTPAADSDYILLTANISTHYPESDMDLSLAVPVQISD